jgi:short-subunit dehydrogenase involved in D-alanine esterification of teichoic acids
MTLSNMGSTGTHLALIPAHTVPGYSASKAALHSYVMSLRESLRDNDLRIIEISPPVVQSKLFLVSSRIQLTLCSGVA